jgi:hypothetical protein
MIQNDKKLNSVMIPIEIPSLPNNYPDYSSKNYWNTRFELKIKGA